MARDYLIGGRHVINIRMSKSPEQEELLSEISSPVASSQFPYTFHPGLNIVPSKA